jgi:cytochrome b561
MAVIGSKDRYSGIAILLHWLTAILVLLAYIFGEGGPESRVYSPERDSQLTLHESLGMAVLLIVVLRVLWRLADRAPEETPMPAWMSLGSKLGHLGLYALLFAVPLTAILGAWSEGHGVKTWLGEIAPLIAFSHDFGVWITELHTWLGDAIMWLAGFHAAAALFHHFVLKDRVLRSMLPWQ